MDRKYLVVIGVVVGVAIGFSMIFIGNPNPTEVQPKISAAEEGTIDSGIIPPTQTVGRTFTASKEGKLYVEFNIESVGPANVSYEVRSPTGKTLLTTPKITSSTILKTDDQSYVLVPMMGSPEYEGLSGNIVFVNYARMSDIVTDLAGSLALAERGNEEGDAEISLLAKQSNVADKGAAALLVFNNKPGIFYGDLTSTLAEEQPTIPTFSISREDGLKLKKLAEEETIIATITDTNNQSSEFTLPYATFDITIDEKGVYELWFHNDGPSNAFINVNYIFRES